MRRIIVYFPGKLNPIYLTTIAKDLSILSLSTENSISVFTSNRHKMMLEPLCSSLNVDLNAITLSDDSEHTFIKKITRTGIFSYHNTVNFNRKSFYSFVLKNAFGLFLLSIIILIIMPLVVVILMMLSMLKASKYALFFVERYLENKNNAPSLFLKSIFRSFRKIKNKAIKFFYSINQKIKYEQLNRHEKNNFIAITNSIKHDFTILLYTEENIDLPLSHIQQPYVVRVCPHLSLSKNKKCLGSLLLSNKKANLTTLKRAKSIICSNELDKINLAKTLKIKRKKISVISNNYDLINITKQKTDHDKSIDMARFASNFNSAEALHHYYNKVDLRTIKFLFLPEPLSTPENRLAAIQCYERLLRTYYVPHKLVLAYDVFQDSAICEYIIAQRLQYDILSLPCPTRDDLIFLYRHASLIIADLSLEGHLSDHFINATNLDSPVLLVESVLVGGYKIEKFLSDQMFIKLYDIKDSINQFLHALTNTAQILAIQKAFMNTVRAPNALDYKNKYSTIFD